MLKPLPRLPSLHFSAASMRRHNSGKSNAPPPTLQPESNRNSQHASFELNHVRKWSERASSVFQSRATELKLSLAQLGSRLNQFTGYEEIEVLKKKVIDQGKKFLFKI
jgi:hypothetical protein